MGSTPIHPNCYITNNDVNFINKFQSAVCEIRFQMPKFIKLEVIEIWTSNLDSGFFAYSLTDIFQIYPISLSLSLFRAHMWQLLMLSLFFLSLTFVCSIHTKTSNGKMGSNLNCSNYTWIRLRSVAFIFSILWSLRTTVIICKQIIKLHLPI